MLWRMRGGSSGALDPWFLEHGATGASPGLLRALRAMVTGTSHLVGLVEPDGTIAYASPSVSILLGYPQESLIGSNILSFLHPGDHGMALSMLQQPATEVSALDFDDADIAGEYRLLHADGRWIPFEVVRSNFVADPDIGGLLVIGREIISRRALDVALSALARDDEGTESLHKLAVYLDVRIPGTATAFLIGGGEDVWVTDSVPAELLADDGPWTGAASAGQSTVDADRRLGECVRVGAGERGFGSCWWFPLPFQELKVYSPFGQETSPNPATVGSMVLWSTRHSELSIAHRGVLERVGVLADVALRRRVATRELRRLVVHDQVSGALSRAGFEGLTSGLGYEPATWVVIDLDDFKRVNDAHGHLAGDQVLRIAVQRIEGVLRPGDLLGRLGGDEFVLRLAGADVDVTTVVADRIINALDAPVSVDGVMVRVGASLGIAPSEPLATYSELIARADAAMYAAKRAGKGRWRLWEPRVEVHPSASRAGVASVGPEDL